MRMCEERKIECGCCVCEKDAGNEKCEIEKRK